MTQNLIISGLQYEELVLLQELMVLVDQTDVIDHPLLIEDRETFESLYNKVMNAWPGLLKCIPQAKYLMWKLSQAIRKMPAPLLSIVTLMQLLSESTQDWVTEEESVTDMIVDINIDELHKFAELNDHVLTTEWFSPWPT